MGIPMGIGQLGFTNTIFKRKFRFTFALDNICGNASRSVPPSFVKVAARPNLSIEETEINFLHAKKWIPGKAHWESITVTYYDVSSALTKPLYDWMASVYNFTDPINLHMGGSALNYAARGFLRMYDGCGTPLETWVLDEVWPTNINFGDVDYATSDEATIEMTLRYANVAYFNECPGFGIDPCCTTDCR